MSRKGPMERNYKQSVDAWLMVMKKAETSVLQSQEINSANNLRDLEDPWSRFQMVVTFLN